MGTGKLSQCQPANFLLDEFVAATNGRYYFSIMYGKNVMGAYADKLSYEERWQVIHHIRSLQAKEKKLQYSAVANSLNPTFGIPESQYQAVAGNLAPAETTGDPAPSTDQKEEVQQNDH